ncbi:MAG TPA: PcfJ domain-containing protein [Chitinophagaceae bacterium]|nr:PcfJ domain-containing protein [Chitinophagaceae bacterium]
MSKKHKKIKEQELLISKEREEGINNALKFSRKRFKKFDEVILQLYLNKDLSLFFADRRIWKVNQCFETLSTKNKAIDRAILKNVFVYLDKWSLLVSEEARIQAVYNMVQFRAYWRKDILEWKPVSTQAEMQINELAFYLFCQYKVPGFLYKAFYEKTNMQFINWFIHIGTGKRVKDVKDIPFAFTQKMGHWFLQAPARLSIAEALRWAQVKGLHGDNKLAERIAYSWMGNKPYWDEDFWEGFIRILVNGGIFNHEKLTELIDYVREVKRENSAYNLKGRTLQSLLRQSDEWHNRNLYIKGNQIWNTCGIDGFKVEKKSESVILEELTGSKLLSDEGRKMRHCVGSYTHLCVTGKTAIFSLRKYSVGILTDTLATVEVSLVTKRVVQAKAKMNRKISDEARKYVDVWAHKNDLSVNPYL